LILLATPAVLTRTSNRKAFDCQTAARSNFEPQKHFRALSNHSVCFFVAQWQAAMKLHFAARLCR
jgi:hypothetical protein